MAPKLQIVLMLIAVLFNIIFAHPVPYEDHESAASEPQHGRVQIKVFRGPTEHEGHDTFAPWGYWVKQPADER